VRDRAPLTRQCLHALVETPPEVEHEVVVVDDGSIDRTNVVVGEFGARVRVVTRASSGGFAAACNDGASATRGDYVVFLNYDSLPQPGWLDVLVDHIEQHRGAGAVGSKLLFPNGLVQHAGVVVCHDRIPRHLYVGFPNDHAAVCRDRSLQAVTAASVLVRRTAFNEIGGFDTTFRNGFEDADLCLRLRERGWEIHYSHRSVVYHLESATQPTRPDSQHNLELWRSRWADRVVPDDLSIYIADRLIEIGYRDGGPFNLRISPLIAVVDEATRQRELEHVLGARSRQVVDLLREVARLTQNIGEAGLLSSAPTELAAGTGEEAHIALAARDDGILRELAVLQERLADVLAGDHPGSGFVPAKPLLYRHLVERVRQTVNACVPVGASVLIVSNGDDELLELAQQGAQHFPQGPSGGYAGYHPENGEAAIVHLEQLRQRGADYLVFPSTSLWWLDHYTALRNHLETDGTLVARADDSCWIFALSKDALKAQHVEDVAAR
jgi:GT2 family glycosyltransferase